MKYKPAMKSSRTISREIIELHYNISETVYLCHQGDKPIGKKDIERPKKR
jgi:hypothetical protein